MSDMRFLQYMHFLWGLFSVDCNEENFNETVILKQMRFDCYKLSSNNGEKPVNPGFYRWIRLEFNKNLFHTFLPTSIEIIATSEVNAYGKNFDIWNHGRPVLPSLFRYLQI